MTPLSPDRLLHLLRADRELQRALHAYIARHGATLEAVAAFARELGFAVDLRTRGPAGTPRAPGE